MMRYIIPTGEQRAIRFLEMITVFGTLEDRRSLNIFGNVQLQTADEGQNAAKCSTRLYQPR